MHHYMSSYTVISVPPLEKYNHFFSEFYYNHTITNFVTKPKVLENWCLYDRVRVSSSHSKFDLHLCQIIRFARNI